MSVELVTPKPRRSRADGIAFGDHVCSIYRSEDEYRQQIGAYVTEGLEAREKILYITHSHTAQQVMEMLEGEGVDVSAAVAGGQLLFLTAADSYLKEGDFDPDRMLTVLRGAEAEALSEGYAGLRVTGEMTWALGGEAGTERLMEYESKLNEFFPGSMSSAICQYDGRRFAAETLLEMLQNHPNVYIGPENYDNRHAYYVPPSGFLGPDRPGAVLKQWLGNLERTGPRAPGE